MLKPVNNPFHDHDHDHEPVEGEIVNSWKMVFSYPFCHLSNLYPCLLIYLVAKSVSLSGEVEVVESVYELKGLM